MLQQDALTGTAGAPGPGQLQLAEPCARSQRATSKVAA